MSYFQTEKQAYVSGGEKTNLEKLGIPLLPPPQGIFILLFPMTLSLPPHKIIAKQIALEGEFLNYGVMILNGCLSVFCYISLKKIVKI